MGVLNLNSIKFPGLPDKYKVAQVADEYSSSSTYAVGDIVNYLGTIYRCTTAITTAENWTAGHWTAIKIADEVTNLKSAASPYQAWVSTQYGHGGDPSDRRFKKDITYDVDGDILDDLKPVRYKFKTADVERYGFIAQDVQKVVPIARLEALLLDK